MNTPYPFRFLLLIMLCSSFVKASAHNSTSEIKRKDDGWQIIFNNEPYYVKGVTFGHSDDPENYDKYFADLKSIGVNSIRTWGTNEHTELMLNKAHEYGISVMLGIWLRHGKSGMEGDDNFDYLNDRSGMKKMYDYALNVVDTYEEHPAILSWGVGNEVYLNLATDKEKKAYSIYLEGLCKTIKDIDSNHFITSVEAWTFGLDWWSEYVPSIDVFGINSYGYGVSFITTEIKKRRIDKPYLITEFGVKGEWDIDATTNGVKVEPTDYEKYTAITKGFKEWISPKNYCLGVYIFNYGNGHDFGSIWLLTHHNNLIRPQYWAIREAYTAKKPINKTPEIAEFKPMLNEVKSNTWVPIALSISDFENEDLKISFHYNQRSGSRKRMNSVNPLEFRGSFDKGFEIKAPEEHGAVKIYVFATDQYGNLGIASTGIMVKDKTAKKKKFLVPKVELPFYVYKNNENLPYFPSAYMGNMSAMDIELENKEQAFEGESCIKIDYKAPDNWFGLGFVDPPNDWGNLLGGYDLSNCTTFSFWAKTSGNNVKATAGFGMIDENETYYDTGKKHIKITLTEEWQQYTIDLHKKDMSCIRTGFVIYSGGNGKPFSIYLDNIVFE